MLKKTLFVLAVLVLFSATAFAQSKYMTDANWFVKGGIGFDATKPELEKSDLNFAGDFKVLRLIKNDKIAIQGGYTILQDPAPDIDYYSGTIVYFTRSIKDQGKFNPYLLAGGGVTYMNESGEYPLAYDVGVGILFPLFGITPNLEIKVMKNGKVSKATVTLGLQIGMEMKP